MERIEAHPLYWPSGWPRTETRQPARFRVGRKNRYSRGSQGATISAARDNLFNELNLMGVDDWDVVLSTNLKTRRDGLPAGNQREPDDPGVAVYFWLDGEQRCFPCDRWDRVADNIHAIALSIGALRGLERWGAKHMVDAAFRGFKALPAGPQWWQTLGLETDDCSLEEIRRAYRAKALSAHPDQGGSHEEMVRLQEAYQTGMGLNGKDRAG